MGLAELATPTTPHLAGADGLAAALRSCDALTELRKNLEVSAADAVVVGTGPKPFAGVFTEGELLDAGLRIFVLPADEQWLLTRVGQAGQASPDEVYRYTLQIRRQVSDQELAAYGAATLYRWFWGCWAALLTELRQKRGCVLLQAVDGELAPAWNEPDEEAAQGAVLHAQAVVSVGDGEE